MPLRLKLADTRHIHLCRLKFLVVFPLMAAWKALARRPGAPSVGSVSHGGAYS